MLGIILYLTTIGGVSHVSCLFVGLYALLFRGHSLKAIPHNVYTVLILYWMFILGATLNVAIQSAFTGNIEIPYVWLLPLVFIVAYTLNIKDITWLIALATIEALVGLYEYSIGVNTILPWVTSREIGESVYMYYNKVKGLSDGSATYTIKLLIALVLLEKYRCLFCKWCFNLLNMILLVAIIMCFSRTVLVCALLFKIVIILRGYYIKWQQVRTNQKIILFASFGFILLFFLFACSLIWEDFIFQFSRGSNTLDLSGRDHIWEFYTNFIKNNLFFGNGSFRLLNIDGKHAHNSYLQIVANNGLLLSLLFVFTTFFNIKKRDYVYVFPLLILAFAQYALFWGFSYADVILAFFIFNQNSCRLSLENKRYSLIKSDCRSC